MTCGYGMKNVAWPIRMLCPFRRAGATEGLWPVRPAVGDQVLKRYRRQQHTFRVNLSGSTVAWTPLSFTCVFVGFIYVSPHQMQGEATVMQ